MNKKIFLISTIGADLNIFKSLCYVVDNLRPDKALYIVTNDNKVKENYTKIKKYINDNYKGVEVDYISLEETENVRLIIRELTKKLELFKERDNYYIKIDFTYGKKPISASLFFWGLSFETADEFLYVSGERKGYDNKVFYPSEILNFKRQSILINVYKKQGEILLKNFKFDQLNKLFDEFFNEETKLMFDYFNDFSRGEFKEMNNQIYKFLLNLKISSSNFIKRNKDELSKYKRLFKENIDFLKGMFAFKMQFFYFYDLILCYFKREEFNEVLPLFVNLLDNIFSYLIIENQKKIKNNDYFLSFQEGFFLKRILDNEEVPMSISRKIELIDIYRIDFFKFFDRKLINDIIYKRNNSIFGHGYGTLKKDELEKIMYLRKKIAKKIFDYEDNFYFWYPAFVDLSLFLG